MAGCPARGDPAQVDNTNGALSVICSCAFVHYAPVCCSGIDAGPTADTSSVSTSAQVLAFVQHIKQEYGIKHVFAWHATMGYWSGVSPAAAAVDTAAAAAAQPSQLSSAGEPSAAAAHPASDAAAASEVVLPRVTPIMSDLEPPTNWSQLVS